MTGLYGKIDVTLPDKAEIIEAGDLAELVYVRCILRSRANLTDGKIDRRVASRWFAGIRGKLSTHMKALVDVGLLEVDPDGWRIPADVWAKWNPFAAEVEAERLHKAEAGALGNHNRWHAEDKPSRKCDHCRDAGWIAEPSQGAKQVRSPETKPIPESLPTPETKPEPKPEPSAATPVEQVFGAWVESTGKKRAVLDPKRRRVITAALKHYPVSDLVAAVQGWRLDPHCSGQNDRRTVYNDLDLLLRDSEHIEKFRDLVLDGPPVVAPMLSKSNQALANVLARNGHVQTLSDLRRDIIDVNGAAS